MVTELPSDFFAVDIAASSTEDGGSRGGSCEGEVVPNGGDHREDSHTTFAVRG